MSAAEGYKVQSMLNTRCFTPRKANGKHQSTDQQKATGKDEKHLTFAGRISKRKDAIEERRLLEELNG